MLSCAELVDCLPDGRPASIGAVIAHMEEIGRVLAGPDSKPDGIARFNDLYLETTRGVAHALASGAFHNAAFLEALDIDFACLYFAALRGSCEAMELIPHAWRPLFACRARHILPLQFALAGMNAHINRDLPVALVETSRAHQVDLSFGSPEHEDYKVINRVLEATQEVVKKRLLSETLSKVDDFLGTYDDQVALWSICRARDAAWVNGQLLDHLRTTESLRDAFLGTLDRMVGFAGRGVLFSVR